VTVAPSLPKKELGAPESKIQNPKSPDSRFWEDCIPEARRRCIVLYRSLEPTQIDQTFSGLLVVARIWLPWPRKKPSPCLTVGLSQQIVWFLPFAFCLLPF